MWQTVRRQVAAVGEDTADFDDACVASGNELAFALRFDLGVGGFRRQVLSTTSAACECP